MSEDDPREPREAEPREIEQRVDLSGLSRLSDQPPPHRGEKSVRIIRGLSILLLAVAAAGLPWYFVTRSGGTAPRAKKTTSPSPTASTTVSPTPIAGTFEVTGLDKGVCLRIRKIPSVKGEILDCLGMGVRVRSDGKTQEAEGRLWRYVLDPIKKVWGWAADQYLKPA